jgi:hypothetical protein
MLAEIEVRDLCCICAQRSGCIDRGSVNRPKFHCEEFDIGVESRPLSEEIALSIAPIVGGLCCNCANRTHCVVQPEEGDIWHCEEYC